MLPGRITEHQRKGLRLLKVPWGVLSLPPVEEVHRESTVQRKQFCGGQRAKGLVSPEVR